MFERIISILFPEKCLSCRKDGVPLCQKCAENLPKSKPAQDLGALTFLDYKDKIVRRAIHLLKYKHSKSVARTFAKLIYNSLFEELAELRMFGDSSLVLVPIPMSFWRKIIRGQNHTEILVEEIINLDNEKFLVLKKNILSKNRETKTQVSQKKRSSRIENVRNSFLVKNKNEITGKTIILLDDVITTGATMKEASRVLKEAGAKKIICVAVAH